MKKIKKLILVALILSMTGCSAIVARTNGGEFGHPFSGTAQAVLFQPCGLANSAIFWFWPYPIFLADIPISLAADIILLPADLIMMSSAGPAYSNVHYYPLKQCAFGA
ncbi:YceK/YidQ family lipoprotein [Vibrio sp. Of7-15]|uniref:YceK/YidQ family lipoprotein n=1 Tax=Vibrio sp. Of7-15 TaxID=2724879 RepID=UPI001EF3CA3F|nr:YceK/YidQ family lipoprotein [Vibrio sp. Of7-15]MCG7499628.1 YceK/YidQ family lipoprotein [Vibrio sp. Of7-15]